MGGWEEAHPGQVTPNDQSDIPDHLVSCSVNKAGRKKEEGGGHLELWYLCSKANISQDETLPSWRWLNTCLPV